MSDKHLRPAPHDCRSNQTLKQVVWWYEEHGGIGVYANLVGRGGTRMALIPWRALRQALERKDKP